MSNTRLAYQQLRDLIAQRQAYERLPEQDERCANHPTTLNFFDIHGRTPLQYAGHLGDVSALNELLQEGASIDYRPPDSEHSALHIALRAGQLDAARLLYQHGASCQHIPAADVHENCRVWFLDKLRESIELSFGEIKSLNSHKLKNSQFFVEFNAIKLDERMIELGELDYVKLMRASPAIDIQRYGKAWLLTAARNGQIAIVDYLIQEGVKLDAEEDGLTNSPLHLAVSHGHIKLVDYLIAQDAGINSRNECLQTPAMLAAQKGDMETLKLLLDNKTDLLAVDIYDNNLLHYAHDNTAVRDLILSHQGARELLAQKNVFGHKPNDSDARCLSQYNILLKLRYFLAIHYRDPVFMGVSGCCNGFAFLRNLYASAGKKQYYFDRLHDIAAWDGNVAALTQSFPDNQIDAKDGPHENLFSLMEQWINDLAWFHMRPSLNMATEIAQHDRVAQLETVHSHVNQAGRIVPVYFEEDQSINAEQLAERMMLLAKMPTGACFEIRGDQHATSGDINEHKIDYYDCNFEDDLPETISSDRQLKLIVDGKYRALQKLKAGDMMLASFMVYSFEARLTQAKWFEFELFADKEYPVDKQDAHRMLALSPNRFTPLHAAAITGSLMSFKRLLHDGYCDVNALDANNRSVLSIAVKSRQLEMIALLLQCKDLKSHVAQIMTLSEFSDYQHYVDYLKRATPQEKVSLCCTAIANKNTEFVTKFITDYPELINQPSDSGQLLMYEAIKAADVELAKVLLLAGANPGLAVTMRLAKKKESCIALAVRQLTNPVTDVLVNVVDPDALDANGKSVLHYAAQYRKLEVVKQLLARHCNPLVLSKDGETPLEVVLLSGDQHIGEKESCISMLLQATKQALLFPLLRKYSTKNELLKLLHSIAIDNEHPVHQLVLSFLLANAIKQNDVDVFAKLMSLANPAILNRPIKGVCAFDLAKILKRHDMIESLSRHGALSRRHSPLC